jgi:hypothetical protein
MSWKVAPWREWCVNASTFIFRRPALVQLFLRYDLTKTEPTVLACGTCGEAIYSATLGEYDPVKDSDKLRTEVLKHWKKSPACRAKNPLTSVRAEAT